MMTYTVTRRLEIDAGHRVMTHGSKCRHLHGHRFVIEAECRAGVHGLHVSGEQSDMVIDFGFLAEALAREVEAPCDHGFIAAAGDDELLAMFAPVDADVATWHGDLAAAVARDGHCLTTETRLATKLYVIARQPTAERLATHWYERLEAEVTRRSAGVAALVAVRVWETPNSMAEYRP